MTTTTAAKITSWKRERFTETPMYTGRIDRSTNYFVASKVGSSWELWIAGQYLGKFKTLKAAKAHAQSVIGEWA